MRRDIEDRAGEGARRTAWLGVALLLCALVAAPSCATFPAAHPFPSLVGSGESLVQEGELTVGDGAEAAVTYRRPFQSPPRVTIVEFRQSWSKDKPYSKSDFVFVRQDATGFRLLNNHPEQGQGSVATIKWRAEGVAGSGPPAPLPRDIAPTGANNLLPQDRLAAALRGMGGTVGFDPPPLPNAPRPIVNIDLHHTKVTDADLERLQVLARLRSLNLSGTGVTDAGMRSVGGLVALQTLLLNETRVGDAGLQQLQHLTELRELSLFHTHVTDDGLAALRGLVNLRDLTLSGHQITDRGVVQLADLRNLRHLYLSDTGVSKTGVQELKKALPKVEIIQ
jgi:hypothetical protein